MPQWGNLEQANNSPLFGPGLLNKSVTTANRDELFQNTTANVYHSTGQVEGVWGVSAAEQSAANTGSAGAHAGWVKRTVGTGGRAGRVFTETLVAMSSISGGASEEDTVYPDARIVVNAQPEDSNTASGTAVAFTVFAVTAPEGVAIDYTWQQTANSANAASWADLSDAGLYSNTSTRTLNVANNATLDGNAYRVRMAVAGGANQTSDFATITVS